MKNRWAMQLSYPYAASIIDVFFGPFPAFSVFREKHLGSVYYSRTMSDVIETYCMGGEL